MKIKVLLTDGNYTNTLAAIRCLSRYGIECYVITSSKNSLCAVTKHCKKIYIIKQTPTNEKYFVKELEKVLKKDFFNVLLPIGFLSNKFIIKYKNRLKKYTKIPTVDYKTFKIAGMKNKIYRFAKKNGINVPKTYFISNLEELKKIKNFPVVIKAVEEAGSVEYAKNEKELIEKYKKIMKKYKYHISLPIIQEYIPGNNGYGFYALYNKGKLITYYIHKRLHMYPRTGGPATMACTYYHEEIYRQGKKILDALKWHGVAMVEFKQHEENGKFYLIEVNPKYWGSLDLGIAAGLDIPYYHVMLALGKKIEKKKYKGGVVFRWPLRDLLYALTGKNKLIELIKWFLLFFNPKIKDNIWVSDLAPTLLQIKNLIIP